MKTFQRGAISHLRECSTSIDAIDCSLTSKQSLGNVATATRFNSHSEFSQYSKWTGKTQRPCAAAELNKKGRCHFCEGAKDKVVSGVGGSLSKDTLQVDYYRLLSNANCNWSQTGQDGTAQDEIDLYSVCVCVDKHNANWQVKIMQTIDLFASWRVALALEVIISNWPLSLSTLRRFGGH